MPIFHPQQCEVLGRSLEDLFAGPGRMNRITSMLNFPTTENSLMRPASDRAELSGNRDFVPCWVSTKSVGVGLS